jgi:hypothetical protein
MVIVILISEIQRKGEITMNNRKSAFFAVAALCILSLAPETFAAGRGGGGQGVGQRLQKRDGSCIRNAVTTRSQTQTQTRTRQRMQNDSAGAAAPNAQGKGSGAMRRLGPGDGTGNAARPMDGTGYGTPAR